MTTTTRITKLSFVLLTSVVLVLSSIAAAQLLLLSTNNNAAYGQPSPSSPQCEPGFTFNRGVCEQPASSFLTCPEGDDPESEGDDYRLEENEEGILVCNQYEVITERVKINEETGEPYCDSPFELIRRPPVEGEEQEIFCLYRSLSDTVEPIPQAYCEDEDATLNTETNTCQMRPGQAPTTTVCVTPEEGADSFTDELTQREISALEREGAIVTEGQCPPPPDQVCVSINGADAESISQQRLDDLIAEGADVVILDPSRCGIE